MRTSSVNPELEVTQMWQRLNYINVTLFWFTVLVMHRTLDSSYHDKSTAFYRWQRSWGKVMFLHVCVILLTGGVCLSTCWDTPLARQTPTPSQGYPLARQPPSAVHSGRYGQQAGGMHPTGMQFLLRKTNSALGFIYIGVKPKATPLPNGFIENLM